MTPLIQLASYINTNTTSSPLLFSIHRGGIFAMYHLRIKKGRTNPIKSYVPYRSFSLTKIRLLLLYQSHRTALVFHPTIFKHFYLRLKIFQYEFASLG